jgi:hypothetical protein
MLGESFFFEAGTDSLVATPFGQVALAICRESIEAPLLSEVARERPDLVLVASLHPLGAHLRSAARIGIRDRHLAIDKTCPCASRKPRRRGEASFKSRINLCASRADLNPLDATPREPPTRGRARPRLEGGIARRAWRAGTATNGHKRRAVSAHAAWRERGNAAGPPRSRRARRRVLHRVT